MAKGKKWHKQIVHVSLCGAPESVQDEYHDVGEVEGMFDYETGELLGWWSSNDGHWRTEYFSGFMQQLGIKEVDLFQYGDQYKKFEMKLYETVKDC
jgi:hypothetical protein